MTKKEFKALQALYGSDEKIAAKLKITRQAVGKIRRKLKMPSSKSKINSRDGRVLKKHNQGDPVSVIATSMKLSRSHVYRILKYRTKPQMELKL